MLQKIQKIIEQFSPHKNQHDIRNIETIYSFDVDHEDSRIITENLLANTILNITRNPDYFNQEQLEKVDQYLQVFYGGYCDAFPGWVHFSNGKSKSGIVLPAIALAGMYMNVQDIYSKSLSIDLVSGPQQKTFYFWCAITVIMKGQK